MCNFYKLTRKVSFDTIGYIALIERQTLGRVIKLFQAPADRESGPRTPADAVLTENQRNKLEAAKGLLEAGVQVDEVTPDDDGTFIVRTSGPNAVGELRVGETAAAAVIGVHGLPAPKTA